MKAVKKIDARLAARQAGYQKIINGKKDPKGFTMPGSRQKRCR